MMSNKIRELKVVCPHCRSENRITYVAEIETYRIDCSNCHRAVGYNLDTLSEKDARIELQRFEAA